MIPQITISFLLILLPIFHARMEARKMHNEYTLLCLGDSYTIGEGVQEEDRFPNQAVLQLHSKGFFFEKPKIIAQTGWTTNELQSAIQKENIKNTFDFVTLLIGVNNQYRERSIKDYKNEFTILLDRAISFAGGNNRNVIVLSIPDWGVTPFAEGRDKKKIAEKIDLFNSINKEVSQQNGVHYIDVTDYTRQHPHWLVNDRLHPSTEMYAIWAKDLADTIAKELK